MNFFRKLTQHLGVKYLALLLLLFFWAAALMLTGQLYYHLEYEHCIRRLEDYTSQIALEIRRSFTRENTYLQGCATALSADDLSDRDALLRALSVFGRSELITRTDLVFPDGSVLNSDGFSFGPGSVNADAYERFSDDSTVYRITDNLADSAEVLVLTARVSTSEGQAGLLCGIVPLTSLADHFSLPVYNHTLRFSLIEGQSGHFLVDTWHTGAFQPENTSSLSARKPRGDSSAEQFIEDRKAECSGSLVFHSESLNEDVYNYYEPVGFSDWMLMVHVPESQAFAHAHTVRRLFLFFDCLMAAAFAIFMAFTLRIARRETAVKEKQLKNVRYLLDVSHELSAAEKDLKRMHGALACIAQYADAEQAFFWLAKRRAELGQRLWSSDANTLLDANADLRPLFPGVVAESLRSGSFLCYDLEELRRRYPLDAANFARLSIHSLMLIPVERKNGALAGILGLLNLRYQWKDADLLQQVSANFSAALDYYENNARLQRMGMRDSLTGLLNQNSYYSALDAIEPDSCSSMACIYADANGLHELNNKLGHEAGNLLLKSAAQALKQNFSRGNVYRIGGDEFVVLLKDCSREEAERLADAAQQQVRTDGYEISIGVGWQCGILDIQELTEEAEAAMQKDKAAYYAGGGAERQQRKLNAQLERLIAEKNDADSFLRFLAPSFKGVYIVNLNTDTMRYFYIPDYFAKMMDESEWKYSKALLLYAQRLVIPEHRQFFVEACDYASLRQKLENEDKPIFTYRKTDGRWIRLHIIRSTPYTAARRETLWIFEEIELPKD